MGFCEAYNDDIRILVCNYNRLQRLQVNRRNCMSVFPVACCRYDSLVLYEGYDFQRRIVLPQALRTAFPPLSNSLIGLVKDTSLASNITVMEMFMATQRIAARTYEMLPLYCEVAVIYLLFSTVLTFLQRAGEKRLSAYGKRKG